MGRGQERARGGRGEADSLLFSSRRSSRMEPQSAREKWDEDKNKREGGGEKQTKRCFPSPLSLLFVLAPLFVRSLRFHSRRSPRGKEETTRSLYMSERIKILNCLIDIEGQFSSSRPINLVSI